MSTASQRRAWAPPCANERMVVTLIHGGLAVRVDARTVNAWQALSACFAAHNYKANPNDPGGPGGYNCRSITGGSGYSLHAYGIACDINPSTNPYSKRLVTDVPRAVVDAVLGLRTTGGIQVFTWGGDWDQTPSTPHRVYDPMHWEIRCTPSELARGVDVMTIPAVEISVSDTVTVDVVLPVLHMGAKGSHVKLVQTVVGIKVDGAFGPKTRSAVKQWQANHDLRDDGIVGANTWRLMLEDR